MYVVQVLLGIPPVLAEYSPVFPQFLQANAKAALSATSHVYLEPWLRMYGDFNSIPIRLKGRQREHFDRSIMSTYTSNVVTQLVEALCYKA
jgi:hypothetical protein